ncbi:hypothetical protein GCM10020295_71140 [Streptomyces cinereospinus]
MARPSRYPLELRRRAVRMVAEVRDDYPNETAALQAVADKLDIGSRETPRNRVKQHDIDAGTRPGTTTEESAQLTSMTSSAIGGRSSLGSSPPFSVVYSTPVMLLYVLVARRVGGGSPWVGL